MIGSMRDEVTVHIAAPPDEVWALVADVTQVGRLSPETFEAEWVGGATGPAVGARFKGHVRRGGRGPVVYWTLCEVTACEPGRLFGFDVLGGGQRINTWLYRFEPSGDGTDVTESFALVPSPATRAYWAVAGWVRRPFNRRNLQTSLERLKAVAEADAKAT
jgi:ligand-binding SRPBCC domain-containing protein